MTQLAPESIVPLMDLAELYREQHDYVAAIEWLQRAARMAPEDAEIHFKLAQCR